jgi:hypothetical protein
VSSNRFNVLFPARGLFHLSLAGQKRQERIAPQLFMVIQILVA